MLQLKNNTPFAAAMVVLPNESGIDALYVMVKASFQIGPQWTLAEKQEEPTKEDVYYGEPGKSSLRTASDYHIGKPATDVLISGFACAPQAAPVRQLDVHVRVAEVSKTIRVFGDRHWDGGRVSTPEPFTSIPLVYERAFGGLDLVDGQVRSGEGRNPVGVGFCGKRKSAELNGQPLPNLECPRNLIRDPRDTPPPASFGPIAPHWSPRAGFAGTYDQDWQHNRAPYLPDDYSRRFTNCAHPDLVCQAFLTGGEPVTISGMHPSGELRFQLPLVKLASKIVMAGTEHMAGFNLESVIIDSVKMQLSLVWRSVLVCDKHARRISTVSVSMTR